MIPKSMHLFLKQALPERTWRNRLVNENGLCSMDFSAVDVERLSRLGITVDELGPKLVACLWDENSPYEVGGYLVVDNLAMGRPAMGGIRMLPDLTPAEVFYRARGMTLKNAAANLPYGGCKAGIVSDPHLSDEKRQAVIQSFARLLVRYGDIFLPGPDVGTSTEDMKLVAIQNGLDMALSKPVEMGGNRLDEIGAAGGGLVIALQALLNELPRLRVLPQFKDALIPEPDQLTVMLQGFGVVGANAARILVERMPNARVVGVSDTTGYLYNEWGLPVKELYQLWQSHRSVSENYYSIHQRSGLQHGVKYSTSGDDLLRESVFCCIPATPVANYLDTDSSTQPSITVDRMGKWFMIIEGANTYSPDPSRRSARQRIEREVYRQRGVLIATDYLVNSGAVIYAAQEHIIKTPRHLHLPETILGDTEAVEKWLLQYSNEFEELSERRRLAAEKARNDIIARNMHELVSLLVANPDMLPCEAAEKISIERITSSERQRTAAEIMEPAVTVGASCSMQEAAYLLIETGSSLLAVVDDQEMLVGVLTQWDITRAAADGEPPTQSIHKIMTTQVVSASLSDSLVEVVRKLEHHEISVIPIVKDKKVLGLISTDLLTRRSLLPLLVKQKT